VTKLIHLPTQEYAEEYGEEYAEGGGEVVTAAWAYEAQEENELSFDAGEQITVTAKIDEGWWTGTNSKGESGMFPANYIQGHGEG